MSRYALAMMIALATAIGACSSQDQAKNDNYGAKTEPAADNTAQNVSDKDGKLPTPMDQGESEGDLKITQSIRQTIMDDKTLSTNAKNVKIITRDGIVTLRGPVETAIEKKQIETLAHNMPGVTRVDCYIEVTRS